MLCLTSCMTMSASVFPSVPCMKERRGRRLGAGMEGRRPNADDFATWLRRRYMPPLRPEAARLMRAACVSSTDALMFGSLGLNLSDQYWFKPEGVNLDWYEVNFFENGYERATEGPLRTPDSSTPGALEKRWERVRGTDFLIKGSSGSDEREPYNELLATRLMKRLLSEGEYVPYRLVERDGHACSSCPTFVTPETEFVPAADVAVCAGISEGRDFYRGYAAFCESKGIPDVRTSLAKMIVCDHLMANFDRHRCNFGLVRTVESLDGWRVAPLFDNGAGFFSRASLPELEQARFTWTANPFDEYPSQQLARVEDLSWYDPILLANFADEVREVLSTNSALPAAFVEHAARHVQRNIDTVNDLAAERNPVWAGF